MQSVCVFCGSSPGLKPVYMAAARALGEEIARQGLSLIYGGSHLGLMGAVADAAMAAGGEVIGVIPEFMQAKEIAHRTLSHLHIVGSMHERKAKMAELADAFIAMPGGFGTLEEFCEILTWGQLGLHKNPHGLLNIEGYFDPLLALFDRAVEEGFLNNASRALVLQSPDPADLLTQLAVYKPRYVDKWLRSEEQT